MATPSKKQPSKKVDTKPKTGKDAPKPKAKPKPGANINPG